VDLLELESFGWKNTEQSLVFEAGATWSSAKHALGFMQGPGISEDMCLAE
jgi:hypothetical protein